MKATLTVNGPDKNWAKVENIGDIVNNEIVKKLTEILTEVLLLTK